MDPPEHQSYRRIVSGRFTPRALEAVRPRVVAPISSTALRSSPA